MLKFIWKPKSYQLVFICLLCLNPIFSQSIPSQSALDSIFQLVRDQYGISPEKGHEALDRVRSTYNSEVNADLFNLLYGEILIADKKVEEGVELILKSKQNFIEKNDEDGIIRANSSLRTHHKRAAEFSKAVAVAFESVEILEKNNDLIPLAREFTQISDLFWYMSRLDESADYAGKAIDILSDYPNSTDLAYAYQMSSGTYLLLGDYDRALKDINTAIEIRKSLGNTPFELTSAINSRGNVYKYMENFSAAIADYQSNLDIHDSIGFQLGIRVALANLGHVHILNKDYSSAIPYKLRSLKIQQESGDVQQVAENAIHLAESYAGLGNYKEAYKYMLLSDTSKLAVYQNSLSEMENELSIKYETEKKEENIESLNQRVRQQNISMGLGLLLLIFSALGLVVFSRLNKSLKKKNAENEILNKEIHHRVKNNLQILSSLLSLQSDHIADENAVYALNEGRSRVESMGLIHQKLYSNDDITNVNMTEYTSELCRYLEDSFSNPNRTITIKEDVNFGLMDVDYAIPLGLIINELVTNSIKYAYPNNTDGRIHLSMHEYNDVLTLEVADDGSGVTDSKKSDISTSFGTKLISSLSRKLSGDITIDESKGYRTTIHFKRYKK